MVAIAEAFIRLRADPDRASATRAGKQMGDDAGKAAGESMGDGITRGIDGKLRDSRGRFVKDGESIGDGIGAGIGRGIGRSTKKAADGTSAFGNALALGAARATLFGASAAATLPSVINLTAALAPAAGAALALPAAMLSIRAASAVVKIAIAGVGAAIEKGMTGTAKEAAKALEGLPPAARSFAQSIIALRPQVEALRASVAQRFFQPLQDEIQPLAQLYFPMLRDRMSELAGPLGGLGEQIAQSARRAGTFRAVASIFDATRLSVINVRGAVDPLVGAFSALITSTAPFLPGLAQGFTNLAGRVGAFVTQAARSGQIAQAFRNAMTVIRDLGGILVNVGSILGSVFTAASRGSGTLLGNLRALTGQVAAFLRSAEGSGALTAVFSTLATLGAALRTSLAAVLPAVARSLGIIGPVIAGLAGPASQLVVALAPLLPYFTSLTAIVLRGLTPAIAALAGWMARNQTAVQVLGTAVAGIVVGIRAWSVVMRLHAAITGIVSSVTLAWGIATGTAGAAATGASIGVRLLGAAIRFAMGPVGIAITVIGLLSAAVVYLWKNNETFRRVVLAVWGAIQVAIRAVGAWFTGTLMPSIRTAINQGATAFRFLQTVGRIVWQSLQQTISIYWTIIRGVFVAIRSWLSIVWTAFTTLGRIGTIAWQTLRAGIAAVWTSIRTGSFQPLRDFITRTLPGAFRTGVGAIRAAWDAVKAAASKPVEFVVHQIINPLIRGYNKIAGVFNAPKASEIIFGTGGGNNAAPRAFSGRARGGIIPGPASLRDNRLAMAPNGPLAVASGEYIVNSRSTAANLPLIQAINKARGRVDLGNIDPYLDGAARGGMIGDGIGDFLGRVWSGFKGIGSFIADPVKGLKRVAGAAMDRIPGAGPILHVLRGMGGTIVGGIGKLLAGMGGGGALGGGNIAGGWRGMRALIAARFPGLGMISGFRPGARTLSGSQSYHALGRAVDYPPNRALAAWIRSTYGARTKELITPWQDLNLWNGRPHTYHGAVWNQHNFAGGNAHVHWAAALGGLVSQMSGMPLRLFDQGGAWPSGTLGANLSGRTEYVTTGGTGGGDVYEFHFHGPVASEQGAEDMVVKAVKAAKRKRRL